MFCPQHHTYSFLQYVCVLEVTDRQVQTCQLANCCVSQLCETRVAKGKGKGQVILSGVSHPLYGEYELLPSGQRYSTEQHLFGLPKTGILPVYRSSVEQLLVV